MTKIWDGYEWIERDVPYWHKFRVHLDWRQDGEFPNDIDFYLVWHRPRLR